MSEGLNLNGRPGARPLLEAPQTVPSLARSGSGAAFSTIMGAKFSFSGPYFGPTVVLWVSSCSGTGSNGSRGLHLSL